MRLLKRQSDEDAAVVDDGTGSDERVVERPRPADTEQMETVEEPDRRRGPWFRRTVTVPMTVPQRSLRQTMRIPSRRIERSTAGPAWNPSSIAAIVVGGALAVVGIIAMMRTGVNETWFRPREEVLDANHTALLGAVELAAGAFVLLLGIVGSRVLIAMAGIAGALAATAAAVSPEEVNRELAIESWWAWVLAAVGVLLALVSLQPAATRQNTIVDVR